MGSPVTCCKETFEDILTFRGRPEIPQGSGTSSCALVPRLGSLGPRPEILEGKVTSSKAYLVLGTKKGPQTGGKGENR